MQNSTINFDNLYIFQRVSWQHIFFEAVAYTDCFLCPLTTYTYHFRNLNHQLCHSIHSRSTYIRQSGNLTLVYKNRRESASKTSLFFNLYNYSFSKGGDFKIWVFWEYKKRLNPSFFRHSTKSEFDSSGDWENKATR